jgi:8-oxo-dGTP diphosphatase
MNLSANETIPKIGVAALIKLDKRLLLIRRKGAHGEGTWAVPGGHLDFGESPAACAIREVREEVGLVVSDPRCIALTNDIFAEEDKHYITLWMRVECADAGPVIPAADEVSDWGWFALDSLPAPLFLPLENLLKGRDVICGSAGEFLKP